MTEPKHQLFGVPQPKFGINSLLRFDKRPKESRKISIESHVDDIRQGLVGYWNDDGKSATTWLDQADGHLNNGTIYGAGTPPSATPGALGYTFDGVDDYVDAGNNIDIPIISISAWINMSNYQGFRAVTKATDSIALGGVQWAFGTTALGLYYFQLYSAGRTTNNLVATGGSAINEVNEWHLFSSVYNGDNGSTIKLYLDNNPLSMTYTPGGTGFSSFSGNSNINIGVLFKNNAPIYANGSIDEVRIYNRALGADEINYLYQKYRIKFGV